MEVNHWGWNKFCYKTQLLKLIFTVIIIEQSCSHVLPVSDTQIFENVLIAWKWRALCGNSESQRKWDNTHGAWSYYEAALSSMPCWRCLDALCKLTAWAVLRAPIPFGPGPHLHLNDAYLSPNTHPSLPWMPGPSLMSPCLSSGVAASVKPAHNLTPRFPLYCGYLLIYLRLPQTESLVRADPLLLGC